MDSYIKNLAGDLLNLEINTIVKDNTTGSKMPSNKRMALLDIANRYRKVLTDYGLVVMANGNEPSYREGMRKPTLLHWEFGGEFSFVEIRNAATAGLEFFERKAAAAQNEEEKNLLEKRIKMLTRIERQSANLIGMFKNRRKEYGIEASASAGGDAAADLGMADEFDAYPSQHNSFKWNNDLSIADINQYGDMDLMPDQITLIRKIWEIGTQQVLMQTIVQLDGDVTCYVTNQFMELPDEVKKMAMKMHNDSIATSTSFWATLFQLVSNLAGKAFGQLFSSGK